jgi:hypothetical protein
MKKEKGGSAALSALDLASSHQSLVTGHASIA